MSTASAIVVAAGQGRRMGLSQNKVYLELKGRPLLQWTLESFLNCQPVKQLIVVVAEDEVGLCQSKVIDKLTPNIPVELCVGGAYRQASVFNGLQQVDTEHSIVLIHDGARPLVSRKLIQKVIAVSEVEGSAIAALPVFDSLKRADDHQRIIEAPSREQLFRAQTPQGFRYELIHQALTKAEFEQKQFTDDAGAVAEYTNVQPQIVMGEMSNIKVTTPEDLDFIEWLIDRKS